MSETPRAQPKVETRDTGADELLQAHRAISTAWYLNWHAQQAARLEELVRSRSVSTQLR